MGVLMEQVKMTKVLLPFESLSRLDRSLDSALNLAAQMSAEIVLLRVNPPTNQIAATTSDRLYSELKALQVQLAGSQVPVTIDTMPGSRSDAIAGYADSAGEEYVLVDELNLVA
jgi:hypothetical protein